MSGFSKLAKEKIKSGWFLTSGIFGTFIEGVKSNVSPFKRPKIELKSTCDCVFINVTGCLIKP